MLNIMLKDLKYYLISYFLVYPLISIYWILKGESAAFLIIVFVQTMIMGALIVLPPLFTEQEEDANEAYVIFHVLPLTRREIMGAKYILPLLNSNLLFGSNLLIFSFSNPEDKLMNTVFSIQILTVIICLFIVGLVYPLVAKIGYTNFLRFSSAVTVVLAFLSVPLLSIFKVGFYELTEFFLNILNIARF